jgi:methyl-accepting chemotaxis protein
VKSPKNTRGLRWQILVPTLLTTSLLLVSLGVFMVLRSAARTEVLLKSKAESTATLLATIGAPYIVNYDYPSLEGFVEEAAKDPEVVFVIFCDANAKPLTTKSGEPKDKADIVVYERQIKAADTKAIVGRLRAGYSLKNVRAQTRADGVAISAAILGGGLVVTLLLIVITRRITQPIHLAISQLEESSGQVGMAANQVSSTGRQVAESASLQSAALQETASSLEEMTATTKRNAGTVSQMRSRIEQASRIVERVNTHMGDMDAASKEAIRSSQQTSKIIKTIDEIAFQTNILALNAAVEAARAGEAGAGFAVVADEVRALAARAAKAAETTSGLIKGTISAVTNGSQLTSLALKAFQENVTISSSISGLVDEVSGAFEGQSQGIDRLSHAMNQMNHGVQQNAANAEESAAAAQELSSGARSLQGVIEQFASLVGRD